MNTYDKIMQLNEAESFKSLIKKWDVLYNNMLAFPHEQPIILPDILWVAPPGSGRTKLIELMAEYLQEKKQLMEFFGNVSYFEFMLGYCSPHEKMEELQRFIQEVQWATGFRNEYKGIININITEWLQHIEEKNFILFLEYLSANSRYWLIILSVEQEDEPLIEKLETVISMFFRIEKVQMDMPKTQSLLERVISVLEEYGLSINQKAQKLLEETIDVLKHNRYFDGYKTAEMLAQDIIYECMSSGKSKSVLREKDLAKFSSESEYVKKTIRVGEAKSKMGF